MSSMINPLQRSNPHQEFDKQLVCGDLGRRITVITITALTTGLTAIYKIHKLQNKPYLFNNSPQRLIDRSEITPILYDSAFIALFVGLLSAFTIQEISKLCRAPQ